MFVRLKGIFCVTLHCAIRTTDALVTATAGKSCLPSCSACSGVNSATGQPSAT
jgi:hypothetical protein